MSIEPAINIRFGGAFGWRIGIGFNPFNRGLVVRGCPFCLSLPGFILSRGF